MKKSLFLIVLAALLITSCTITNNPVVNLNNQTITGSGTTKTETRDVSGFNAVVLKSIGDVKITHGDAESITITADDNLLPYITTEVVNGTLEIGTKPNININPSKTITYDVTVKDISSVMLSGFGNINADSLDGTSTSARLTGSGDINIADLSGTDFSLDLTGFGNITVDKAQVSSADVKLTGSGDISLPALTTDDLKLVISGLGDATVSGTAKSEDITLTGSGNFKGKDFQTGTAKVTITGLGDATVWASDTVSITISGSGSVSYYGSPVLNTTLTGMGSVKSLGEK